MYRPNARRRILLLAAVLVVGATGGLATAAPRQQGGQKPVSLTLFRGEVGGDSNVRLGAWGSGNAEESREAVLTGTRTIKVTTQGMYQGARVEFPNPIDLSAAFANPHTYIRLRVRFSGAAASQAAFDPTTLQATRQATAPFRDMRYLLVMADGSRHELVRPVELPPSQDPDSWSAVAFPLSAIGKTLTAGKTLTGEGAKIKQIAIFGDRYAQFLIGEMDVITDETDITIAPIDDVNAFANSATPFVANAEGGASTLRYSWDFDASDGIQEDAVGRVVSHVFPRSTPDNKGNSTGLKTYKVTLTVSDVDGIKKPTTITTDINVSD